MTKRIALFLFGLGIAFPALAQGPPFAHLSTEGEAVLLATLNGFPVANDSTYGGSKPVNVHLVPGVNRLVMKGRFLSDGIDTLAVTTMELGDGVQEVTYRLRERPPLIVRLKVYGPESIVGIGAGSDDGGGVLFERVFRIEEQPFDIDTTFALPDEWDARFTAGHRYTDAPVIDDEDALRDYALHLARLLDRGDLRAFQQEFKPKIDDYARAFGLEIAEAAEQFARHMAGLREDGPRLDFSRDEVVLTPWAGGRVWELSVAGQETLIHAETEYGYAFLGVFVGLVDGALKVIR